VALSRELSRFLTEPASFFSTGDWKQAKRFRASRNPVDQAAATIFAFSHLESFLLHQAEQKKARG
jgi:hypothetical protein